MHARAVIMEMLPIDVKEAVRVYGDRVVPAAREQEGFKGGMDADRFGDRRGVVDIPLGLDGRHAR